MHDQNDLTYFDKQPVHQNWEEYDNYLKKLVAVSLFFINAPENSKISFILL